MFLLKNGDAASSPTKPILESISTPNDDISANVTVETTHPVHQRYVTNYLKNNKFK